MEIPIAAKFVHQVQFSLSFPNADFAIFSGFSLFLWIVIQRLASLLKDKATAKAEASAAKSQAESASRTAELLLDQNKENEEKGKIENNINS